MAKVYPNGLADVNHFMQLADWDMINDLLDAGLLRDVTTVMGQGLDAYPEEPKLTQNGITEQGTTESQNDEILRPSADPFQKAGGLKQLSGNLGTAIKISAVATERHVIGHLFGFSMIKSVKNAFKAGEFTDDTIVVIRFQRHSAYRIAWPDAPWPCCRIRLKVALVTDGRMSGASGKCPPRSTFPPRRP